MFSWFTDLAGGAYWSAHRTLKWQSNYMRPLCRKRVNPRFIVSWEWHDTVPGRFEVISLHMFIVLDRLSKKDPDETDKLAQQLVECDVSWTWMMWPVKQVWGIWALGRASRNWPEASKVGWNITKRKPSKVMPMVRYPRGSLSDAITEIFFIEGSKRICPRLTNLADYMLKKRASTISLICQCAKWLKHSQLFGEAPGNIQGRMSGS